MFKELFNKRVADLTVKDGVTLYILWLGAAVLSGAILRKEK